MANGNGQDAVNSIIAQALEDAGVQPKDIEIPPVEKPPEGNIPSLDGKPLPATKDGDESEAVKPAEVKPAEVKPGEPVVQPFGKTEILTAINEASSKFQSIMDKKINAIDYQMKQTVGALNKFFQAQETPDITGLPAEEQVQKRLERLEKPPQQKIEIQTNQPIEQQAVNWVQICADILDTVGIAIDDKRVDWAKEPGVTAEDGFTRFKVSVKKALLEDQTKLVKDLRKDGDKVLKNLRKKTGVDVVSTSPPSGPGIPNIKDMSAMQLIEHGIQQQEELSQVAK